jgi:hypothetical protein
VISASDILSVYVRQLVSFVERVARSEDAAKDEHAYLAVREFKTSFRKAALLA